jgi:hypothetical protein
MAGVGAATMQMLAGAPEFVLVAWLMLATLWLTELKKPLFKISAFRLAGSGVLVLGLCAIQLLPFLQLALHSDRSAAQTNSAWSMPPDGLANLLVPMFHCTKTILGAAIQVNQQWTSSYYVGIGIVALGFFGAWKVRSAKTWWLASAALFGFLMALGDHTFFYPAVKRLFPLFGLARYPIKFILPAIFALPLLAAFAIQWAMAEDSRPLKRNLLVVGASLIGLVMMIIVASRVAPATDENWKATALSGFTRALFLAFVLGVLLLMRNTVELGKSRWAAFGLLVLLGLDLITHTSRQNPTVQKAAFGELALDMKPLPGLGNSRAMVSPRTQAILNRASFADPLVCCAAARRSLFEDYNLIENIPKVNGFFPVHLKEQAAINALLYQPTNYPRGLIDFMGVTQISSDDKIGQWVSRDSALPLFTAGQKPVFSVSKETLSNLSSSAFNPRETVYLPAEALGKVMATNSAHVQIDRSEFSAKRVSAGVTADAPAVVVVAQNHYPAWKAFIDGRPVPIWRANHAFQALEIPAGKHEILIEYRDAFFQAGAAITTLALLFCAATFFRFNRRTHTATPAAI